MEAPKNPPKPMSEWKAGDTVTVRGKISTIMWQHMVQPVPGKKHGYFDVDGEKTQIVVYWEKAPTCTHFIEVTGKVVELRGSSKRPGKQQESKVDESYSERHIDVESTRCAE
jgi:hypothetical protein